MNWPTELTFKNPGSEMLSHYMTGVHMRLSENLENVRETMGNYYNKKCRSIEPFKKAQLVMLNRKNIQSMVQCWKLEEKMYGPFKYQLSATLIVIANWNYH